MPLFDFYIMADWSGGARRRGGRSDSIWIAHGPITDDGPLTDSPYSRTEAIRLIHSLLASQIRSKRRVLVCFDFAYGYPVDFAARVDALANEPALKNYHLLPSVRGDLLKSLAGSTKRARSSNVPHSLPRMRASGRCCWKGRRTQIDSDFGKNVPTIDQCSHRAIGPTGEQAGNLRGWEDSNF
jgi:hypothetical protein